MINEDDLRYAAGVLEKRFAEHRATLRYDQAVEYVRVECSCGWAGENVPKEQPDADHLALAEWAGHVNFAAGAAVEE